MNIRDYLSAVEMLAPETWVVAAIVLASLWNLFFPKAREWTPVWSLSGLALAAVELWKQFDRAPVPLFGGLYTVDRLTVSFGVLACVVGFIVVLMTMGYERHLGRNRGEFYAILLTAVLSVMILSGATDLIMLFVGLETLSLSCVLLSGFAKRDVKSNEAALKYLLSTAATTATLLYGLSFVYGLTGTTNYYEIHTKLTPVLQAPSLVLIFLTVLLLSAVGFKLSAVPFHMWTPDVYEGAPTPVTAFLSIGSKAGGFVVAVRLLSFVFAAGVIDWSLILGMLAIASMIVGNLLALSQTSLKRMLAYSAIAHVGYLLIGLVSNRADGLSAMMFYLIVYGFMNLGAFTAAIMVENETGSDKINDYAGLLRKRPWLTVGLAVCLLNLAGLPLPPAGFFAKVFIFWSGVAMHSLLGWLLVITALATSVPAIYYYTRVVVKMVVGEPSQPVAALEPERRRMADGQVWPACALSLCVAGITLASFLVTPFMNVSMQAVSPVTAPPAIGWLPLESRR